MLVRFFRTESAAAISSLFAAVAALLVANSPLSTTYAGVLHTYILGLSIPHWISGDIGAILLA